MEDMTMLDDIVQRRISILVYDDIPAIHAWLVRVFGLGAGRLEHDASRCVHGEVQAGDRVIWLHQVSPRYGLALGYPGLAPPKTRGAATGTTAVMVEEKSTPTNAKPSTKAPTSSTRPPTSPTGTASTAPATPKAASGHS